jgi:hypothetical protein
VNGAPPTPREFARAWPWPARVGAGLAVAAIVVVVWALVLWIRAALLPSPAAFVAADREDRSEARSGAMSAAVAQLSGRSLFWVPSAPGDPGVTVVEETPQENGEQVASSYEGPSIAAIVLDEVWFSDGTRRKAGADAREDLAVVSTNAPWDATVRWRGKEFKVPFFERDRVIFKQR